MTAAGGPERSLQTRKVGAGRMSLVLVPAFAMLLAGCGGGSAAVAESSSPAPASSGSPAAGSPAASLGAGDESMVAYTECLSKNGVVLPSGGFGGQRPDGAPSGMPTMSPGERPSGTPTDMPSGMPTGMPSGMPSGAASGGPAGGPGGAGWVPDGVDADAWAAAQKACASLAPTMGPGSRGNPGGATGATGATADPKQVYSLFWSCMSDHDVKAPTSGLPADLETSKKAVATALKTCQVLLPESH